MLTAGGSIITTYNAETVTTRGSPPLASAHRDAVIAKFGTAPPNMAGNRPIVTNWYSNGGPQTIDVKHSPDSQTSEQWRRAWIQAFDSKIAGQVPV